VNAHRKADQLADLALENGRLTTALILSRRQFAWIEQEASGDNEADRIIHACQRAFEAIDEALAGDLQSQ